ncbi:MAG: exodeoxyribonuclease VII large subunit, partial [Oscillospiraceae bacterium]|nr:exodeoxyribonuclease VII large subunit [Oscillospiraceae bacterium]
TLKDAACSVKAVMFRGNAQRLAFAPQNGMQVLLRGRISLYERDGAFQIYADAMFPDGAGAAAQAFEELKSRLEKEGLFDQVHKKALPAVPKMIGVVTSKTGAALQDILNVAGRRWPFSHFLLCPVNVQGADASLEIASAIRTLDEDGRAEVIIVGRGGGSAEDLWVFNHEWVARAVSACSVPVISAVGHQVDYTILDFVADLRAPTPSAAAELAVPDAAAMQEKMKILCKNIQEYVSQRYKTCYNNLQDVFSHPSLAMREKIEKLREELFCALKAPLLQAVKTAVDAAGRRLGKNAALTDSLSPYKILARGYAIVTLEGQSVTKDRLPREGMNVCVTGDGYRLDCTVDHVSQTKERDVKLE